MASGDFKDLPRRAASDKVFGDKAFNITKNPKYDECQRGSSSIIYKFLYKGSGIKSESMLNQELA